MPRAAVGTRLKTRPKTRYFSREVYPSVNYEEKWKDAMGRHADIAGVFVENPRSKMKKRDLLRILDQIWDILPEIAQLVARKDLPEKMLYREPEESWKKEEE